MNQITRSTHAGKAMLFALLLAIAAVPGFALASGGATYTLPTAEVLGYVTTALAFIAAIGAAVLGLIFLSRAFKWARKAG